MNRYEILPYSKIQPYDSAKEALLASANSTRGKCVKLKVPSQDNDWFYTCFNALMIVKVLKTVETHWEEARKSYNIKFETKLFWDSTTFQVMYDTRNYLIIIYSGLWLEDYYYTDRGNWVCYNSRFGDISRVAYDSFVPLLNRMQQVLPEVQREYIMDYIRSVAVRKTFK